MKKSLLFLCLLSSSVFAQMDQNNEPSYGSTRLMYVCDSNATSFSSITGNNVVWDYSQLPGVGTLTKSVSLDTIDITTDDAAFVGSTKKYSIGTNLKTFYNSSIASRVSQGFIYTDAGLGNIKAIWDTDDQKIANYPFVLGDFLNDSFSGTITTTNTGTTVANGISYATIDGVGTLKLQQSIHNNVTRYHIKDSLTTNVFGATVALVRDWYEYYDLTTGNYLPLFILINLKIASPFVNNETSLVLSSDQPLTFVGLNEVTGLSHKVYPNPVTDILNFNVTGKISTILISSLDGKTLKTTTESSIDVSDLTSGLYIYKAIVDNEVSTGSFMKN